jgi:hypothetical protein
MCLGAFWRGFVGELVVGGPGFEPGASRSRTVRAAKLRQPPTRRFYESRSTQTSQMAEA